MSEKQPPARIFTPRIIIHGGAGNLARAAVPPERYRAFRDALLRIIRRTDAFMRAGAPTALDVAAHAVAQLEDDALFNAGRGAVFTRDGVVQLEASVIVSRGHAKRAAGVAGLRRVRNPVLLAKRMLERGDGDLARSSEDLDVPSAQGHSLLFGRAAEQLARAYGLALVDPGYFFTQRRWDEHLRGLDGGGGGGGGGGGLAQGTVGAVALDGDGVVCVATSTGGMTNKLTGRVGDTPVPGAGFWAEEWPEAARATPWERLAAAAAPGVSLSGPLRGLLADCLPAPRAYAPLGLGPGRATTTTRAVGVSGTGNGDSFLRVCAARTVGALARLGPQPAAAAVTAVAGPGGELQRSAGERWGRTGEGEGGFVGIESVVERDGRDGRLVRATSAVLMDYNCGGMLRAWIDDDGRAVMSIWANGAPDREWTGDAA